jgi:hypothetical protein
VIRSLEEHGASVLDGVSWAAGSLGAALRRQLPRLPCAQEPSESRGEGEVDWAGRGECRGQP